MNGLLPVGCFGKVPFWREYLEHGVAHPSSRALRGWLHEGKAATSLSGDGEMPEDTAVRNRLRFLMGTPGSAELLVGVLRPSRDGGGRRYPFATFTHIARKTYGSRHHSLLPLALAPVWDVLDDAWDALAEVETKAAFDDLLAELKVPAPAPPAQVRGAYQGGQQDPARCLAARGDGASLDHLDRNLAEFLAELKRGRGLNAPVLVPVSSDLEEAAFDLTFWLDLINRQFLLKRFEPDLFLESTPRAEDRVGFLKFGPLRTEDFPVLMGLAPDDGLVRPAHPGNGAVPPADPPADPPAEVPADVPEGAPVAEAAEAPPPAAAGPATFAELLRRRFR